MPTSRPWAPITDIEGDPRALTDGELAALKRVWEHQRTTISPPELVVEFNRRLMREWAIETGVIENVYTLDRGVTRTLIEKGIDAALIPHGASNRDSVLVERIIRDHYEALEGMFAFVAGQCQLTCGYVKELHAALLRNQDAYAVVDQFNHAFERPLEKGAYKLLPNNPSRSDGSMHEYCPPEHVAAEMDRLMELNRKHERAGTPPEVHAAWLHHRFTQIHPFADGNGRVARALASLVLIKAGWFPFLVRREERDRYFDVLEQADGGELQPLVSMLVETQRNAVIQATDIAHEIRPPATVEEAMDAARDRLVQMGALPLREWVEVKPRADMLAQLAFTRFNDIALGLRNRIGELKREYFFEGARRSIPPGDSVLDLLPGGSGQRPSVQDYGLMVLLSLRAPRNDALQVCFYALGPRFRGLVGVAAVLALENAPAQLLPGTFQVNYEDEPEELKARFSKWLESMLVQSLARWRATL